MNKMQKTKNLNTLPWFAPGPSIKNPRFRLTFKQWDWEDLRDLMYLFGVPYSFSVTQRGLTVQDHRCAILHIAMSMWNMQEYINKEMWDSAAMESRIIAEAVCTYLNRYRPTHLGYAISDAINKCIKNDDGNIDIVNELNNLRQVGCQSVHFKNELNPNQKFRTSERDAYQLLQNVYNIVNKIKDMIESEYSIQYEEAARKLCTARNKLSLDRLNTNSNEQVKVKSCADEAKPKGCSKKGFGCPYLHKGQHGFSIENAMKNLEMLRNYKNNKRKVKNNITDSDMEYDLDSDKSDSEPENKKNGFNEYDYLTDKFSLKTLDIRTQNNSVQNNAIETKSIPIPQNSDNITPGQSPVSTPDSTPNNSPDVYIPVLSTKRYTRINNIIIEEDDIADYKNSFMSRISCA